eukprot:scaffold309222_cov14-Tisochrysis_lutea.AAC.1
MVDLFQPLTTHICEQSRNYIHNVHAPRGSWLALLAWFESWLQLSCASCASYHQSPRSSTATKCKAPGFKFSCILSEMITLNQV